MTCEEVAEGHLEVIYIPCMDRQRRYTCLIVLEL